MNWGRTLLLLAVIAGLILAAAEVPWQATRHGPARTQTLSLPDGPLWSPPATPRHDAFDEVFGGETAHGASRITLGIEWRNLVFRFLIFLWLPLGFAWVVHLGTSHGPDACMRAAGFAFVGMNIAGLLTIGIWVVLGGWGPPMPDVFGTAGLVLGAAVGVATRRRPGRTG